MTADSGCLLVLAQPSHHSFSSSLLTFHLLMGPEQILHRFSIAEEARFNYLPTENRRRPVWKGCSTLPL